MKNSILILLLFVFVSVNAQYMIDRINAPRNPLPLEYTKAHFGLKGNVEKVYDKYKTLTFDTNGNLIQESMGSTYYYYAHTNFSYDANGKLIKQQDTGEFPFEYTISTDSKGRIIKISDGKLYLRTFTYNPKGLLIEQADGSDNKTTYTYDSKGRIIIYKTEFEEIKYTYTVVNNILKVIANTNYTDPKYKPRSLTYYYNNKGFEIDGEAGENHNTYDEMGNPLNGVMDGQPLIQTYDYYTKTPKSKE